MSEGQVQEGNWKFTAPGFTAGANGKVQTGNYPAWATGGNFNPSLVAGWPMNEGTGLALHDVSGSANTATISSAPAVTWQANAGFPGTTPLWNATGNAVAASNALTNFDGTTPFSFAAWVIFGAAATFYALASTLDPANSLKGWEVSTVPSAGANQINVIIANNLFTNAIQVTTNTTANVGALHFVVVTYDGSKTAAGVKIYIDSVLATAGASHNNLTLSTANTKNVSLAARVDLSIPLNGVEADVAIYSAVLTPVQISTYFVLGPRVN